MQNAKRVAVFLITILSACSGNNNTHEAAGNIKDTTPTTKQKNDSINSQPAKPLPGF